MGGKDNNLLTVYYKCAGMAPLIDLFEVRAKIIVMAWGGLHDWSGYSDNPGKLVPVADLGFLKGGF